jgi:lactoylglutathione lyase
MHSRAVFGCSLSIGARRGRVNGLLVCAAASYYNKENLAGKWDAPMQFKIVHTNLNVFDLEKSLKFYREALGLAEVRRKEAGDGSFTIVFLSDGTDGHELELTWLRGRNAPYDLGDNETHVAFRVKEYAQAHQRHKEMGVICFENEKMGLYFISDPDGYWLEILPVR